MKRVESEVQQSRRCAFAQARPARANPSDSSPALPALPLRGVAPVREWRVELKEAAAAVDCRAAAGNHISTLHSPLSTLTTEVPVALIERTVALIVQRRKNGVKIIREGDLKRAEKVRRFECERCGCVWEADASEYRVESDFRNGHYFVMACPTCRRDAMCYPEDERHE